MAARAADTLPMAYHAAFRSVTGGKYEKELEGALASVWSKAGEEQGAIARAFAVPVRNAKEIAEAFTTFSVIFLGPELVGESGEEGEGAVVTTTRCPMISSGSKFGVPGESMCRSCTAYCTSAVKSLNPAYALKHVKGMCIGDPHCEMRIRKK
ncbi:MAG: hypothetical protein RQ758_06805 [Methanomicrobiaceae archaeon]|nr:hypothetical protein [Methanomicrobiaceae archaeon]